LNWPASFYPDDGDGGRSLLLVAESKLEESNQNWEESLRALIRVGGTKAETGAVFDAPVH
jgi:hypothetical protein